MMAPSAFNNLLMDPSVQHTKRKRIRKLLGHSMQKGSGLKKLSLGLLINSTDCQQRQKEGATLFQN
jgi:hypothetical protein